MPSSAPQFDESNQPPAIEPIVVAGAALIVTVLLIIALLLAVA